MGWRDISSIGENIGSLQKQGEPPGSAEVKKIQLLDSIDDIIGRDLRMSSYNTAEDGFRVLHNRYGNKVTIAMELIEELERIYAVKGNQPRKVIELIQIVEKALSDLCNICRQEFNWLYTSPEGGAAKESATL